MAGGRCGPLPGGEKPSTRTWEDNVITKVLFVNKLFVIGLFAVR